MRERERGQNHYTDMLKTFVIQELLHFWGDLIIEVIGVCERLKLKRR